MIKMYTYVSVIMLKSMNLEPHGTGEPFRKDPAGYNTIVTPVLDFNPLSQNNQISHRGVRKAIFHPVFRCDPEFDVGFVGFAMIRH